MQAGEAATLRLAPQVLTRRINWLNSIREWQQEFLGNLTPGEFVNCVMDDLLGRSVFVFTPAGQVMRLSRVNQLACPDVKLHLSPCILLKWQWSSQPDHGS